MMAQLRAPSSSHTALLQQLSIGFRSASATLTSGTAVESLLYTRSKEWFNVQNEDAETAVVAIGLSDEALDEFGDPDRIEATAAAGKDLNKGESIVKIHWEGFMRTASDELYHAVWENVSGKRNIELPFAARVVQYNDQFIENPGSLICPEEDGKNWLVKLEVPRENLRELRSMLMTRQEYLAFTSSAEEEETA